MSISWNKTRQTLLSASILSGTSLVLFRDDFLDVETDEPCISLDEYDKVRKNKKRSTDRALALFQNSSGKKGNYSVVPANFRFSDHIMLTDDSTATLPKLTCKHYQSQFQPPILSAPPKPPTHSKAVEQVTMSKRPATIRPKTKKKEDRGRSQVCAGSKTPPRAPQPSFDDMSEMAGNLAGLGLNSKEWKNAKYPIVTANDTSVYDDTLLLVDGIENPLDIYARYLPHVESKDGSYWMSIYQVIFPLVGLALNPRSLETSMRLVLTTCERKAIEVSFFICYNRMAQDAPTIAFDCEEAFGMSEGRKNGLNDTLVAKKRAKPEGGYLRKILLILPSDHANEVAHKDSGGDDEDEEPDEDPVFYSNCAFNDVNGKEPVDGHLVCATSLQLGDDKNNFFYLGKTKVHHTSAYAVCQIALDGTQEEILYKDPVKSKASDPDDWLEKRRKKMEDRENEMKG